MSEEEKRLQRIEDTVANLIASLGMHLGTHQAGKLLDRLYGNEEGEETP